MLKEQIYKDIVVAMKAKEQIKLDALRMFKAEIMKFEVSGAKKEANDSEVIKILKKLIKQRQDSATQFEIAGREEEASKEKAEIEVLSVYLPAQMSEEEIETIVKKIITESGSQSKADFGKVMGAVMKEIGDKADGAVVKNVLQRNLA